MSVFGFCWEVLKVNSITSTWSLCTVLITLLVWRRLETAFSLYWSCLCLGMQCLGLGLALTILVPSLTNTAKECSKMSWMKISLCYLTSRHADRQTDRQTDGRENRTLAKSGWRRTQSCVCHCAIICIHCCSGRVDLVSEDSSLPSVRWVRHTAGRPVDQVVHLTTAWVDHDPSLVVLGTARHLYKESTWYRASVDQKMDISLLLGLDFRSVCA